ncbi:MAG: MOSC domain-containing protein [Anaerolineae bacterium]|nr:MOSC domain-containing protein [Anaerolineae bacterium]
MNLAPHVASLTIYPVKSCAGISLDQVTIGRTGPELDRRWMIVADDDGEMLAVTQREMPKLALAQPSINGGELIVRAPGMSALRLPIEDDRPANRSVLLRADALQVIDEGLEAAERFGDLLEAEVRLVRLPEAAGRLVSPKYAPEAAYTSLTDGYPVLLLSSASLDDLNRRLYEQGKPAIEMRRFRPTIVVSGVPAYAEDEWRRIRLGEIPFDVVKPCARCVMTTVDPARGEVVDPHEPLATLATYRRVEGKVMFAQNLVHRATGVLRVGDELTVVE